MAADLTRAGSSAQASASDRFRLVGAGLIGLAVAALVIAAAVLVAHSNGTPQSPPGAGASGGWSSFKPAAGGNEGAAEIADYVAPFYRGSGAAQLTVITPVNTTQLNPSTGNFTGSGLTVAVRLPTGGGGSGANGGRSGTSSLRTLNGQTVAFDLCGQGGPNCQLSGTPSRLRLLLLRREALELALYTLEYLPQVHNVVTVLPPGHTEPSSRAPGVTVAVLMTRDGLAPLLAQPLGTTLADIPPTLTQLTTWAKGQEASLVDTVTSRNLFSEQTETEPTGIDLLVLTPLPAA